MEAAKILEPKLKIAIVDDSEVILRWLERSLNAHGFEVATLCGVFGLQGFVRDFKPDLILLDVHMAALRESTVCEMLRRASPENRPQIVFHSAIARTKLEELTRDHGADAFICKHSDPERLASQILVLLSH